MSELTNSIFEIDYCAQKCYDNKHGSVAYRRPQNGGGLVP